MTTLAPTRNNISANEDRGAVKLRFIAAVNVKVGDWVYQDSNNKINLGLADTSAHAHIIGVVCSTNNVAGEDTIIAGDWATVCIGGPVQGFGKSAAGSDLANGESLYVDKTTPGAIADVAPTSAYQYVVGTAEGPDTIMVRPGMGNPVSA